MWAQAMSEACAFNRGSIGRSTQAGVRPQNRLGPMPMREPTPFRARPRYQVFGVLLVGLGLGCTGAGRSLLYCVGEPDMPDSGAVIEDRPREPGLCSADGWCRSNPLPHGRTLRAFTSLTFAGSPATPRVFSPAHAIAMGIEYSGAEAQIWQASSGQGIGPDGSAWMCLRVLGPKRRG